jgi:hypothetical protein
MVAGTCRRRDHNLLTGGPDHRPSANRPSRIFGPCRSASTPDRPAALGGDPGAQCHTQSSARLGCLWLKLSRATSIPASMSSARRGAVAVAGPSVQTIFGASIHGVPLSAQSRRVPSRWRPAIVPGTHVAREEDRWRRARCEALGRQRRSGPPSPLTAVTMASSSSCLPASRSCSIDVLWWPTFSAPRSRFSIEMSGVLPTLAAMSRSPPSAESRSGGVRVLADLDHRRAVVSARG